MNQIANAAPTRTQKKSKISASQPSKGDRDALSSVLAQLDLGIGHRQALEAEADRLRAQPGMGGIGELIRGCRPGPLDRLPENESNGAELDDPAISWRIFRTISGKVASAPLTGFNLKR